MSDYTISIPDSLFQRAQQIADQQSQSVEAVIHALLEGSLSEPSIDIPPGEQAELKAMTYLSDDALFSMMREQIQQSKQIRLTALLEKNTDGTISEHEYNELAQLVEDGQRLTLRKANAMDILMNRGHKLGLDDMKPVNE